jgi:ribosomal protein S18 acetylase RimI-like enzyme
VANDADVEQWIDLFNLSFIDHWNFHPVTVEARRHMLQHPNYLPERDLVALAPDGTFAAFCFCDINTADNERNARNDGWIATLGTRRGYRKIGLGRAMLLAGMHRLKADGVAIAKLGVDAENPTGALGLYESVGFEREMVRIAHGKEVKG